MGAYSMGLIGGGGLFNGTYWDVGTSSMIYGTESLHLVSAITILMKNVGSTDLLLVL